MDLLASKFSPPTLPDVLPRPRLRQRLDSDQARSLVLVTGQAAQGKSTLVAHWLRERPQPTAWVCLDPSHSDPAVFCDLLTLAFRAAGQGHLLSDTGPQRSLAAGDNARLAACRQRLDPLWRHLPLPLNLVLDGLDPVLPAADGLALIEWLIDDLPAGLRLFLISRQMPPLRLQRLKVRQKALVLTNEELAFTADEIKAFFNRIRAIDLGDALIDRIARLTGGWAGALVLIGQWLARQPPALWASALADGLPPDVLREAFRYFAEEVLAFQPPDVQSFMMRAAVLDIMEPAMVADLTGATDSQSRLQELVRCNLFIQALQDADQLGRFVFNPLFADFLRETLQATGGPAVHRRLLVKAGKRYVAAHRSETAIPFFLQADAVDLAAAAIKKAGPDWVIKGLTADLASWIGQLPAPMVRADPWLLYLMTMTRRLDGGRRSIDDFQAALDGFTAGGDKRGQMLALAGRIETAVFAGQGGRELAPWLNQAETLIRQMGETVFYAYAKATLWMQIGFGCIAGAETLPKGLSACQSAYLLAKKIGNAVLQITTTVVGALGQTLAGQLSEAERSLARIDAGISLDACPEYRILKNLVSLDLALNRGDETTARRYHDTVQRDIEAFGLQFLYPAFIAASVRLDLSAGQLAAAAMASRHLADVAVLADNAAYAGIAAKLEALVHYHGGKQDLAVARAANACRILINAGRTGSDLFEAKLIQGLSERCLGAVKRGERLVDEALVHFKTIPNPLAACQAHMAMALIKAGEKDGAALTGHLTTAFQIARDKGYGHFPLISPRDLSAVCMLALQNDVAAEAAARLLFSGPVQKSGLAVEEVVRPLGDNQPVPGPSLRRALRRAHLPRLNIQTFGGFSVRRGDTPIAEKHWTGSRPRLLLKSLVVHGSRDVPKDIVIEDLWPDSGPAAALQSFKVTLHRLRKILEPDMDPAFGSSYVHLKDNLVSLDPDLCRCDVETFIDICRRITGSGPDTDPEHLYALSRRLDELVIGDFLPEEPYAPWIALRRKALKEHFVGVMQKAAGIFQRLGRWELAAACYQAMIRCDTVLEPAHRGLMLCYARQGLRSQAIKVYEDFKTAVASDLGAVPDQATTDLFNEILKGP